MKKKLWIGFAAFVLMLIGAMCFIPVSVFSTTTTPVLYGTNVPTADSTANNTTPDVIGSKSDAAATGAVDTTTSIMGYVKQLITDQIVIDAFFDVPTADVATNTTVRDVVGNKTDAAVGSVTTDKSLMGYTKGVLEDTGTTIPALHAVPVADVATNANARDVVGNKTDAAVGAVTTDKSLMGYAKGILEDTGTTIPALHAVPVADVVTNANARDVVGNKTDAAVGTVAADKSLMGYAKGILTDTGTTIPATLAAMPQCVVKTDGACLAGVDPIFTITGGPVRCKIVGLVTTVLGATVTNLRLQHITTAPAATVELNAGAVAVTDDAVGTFYYNVGDTSVFTPSTGLGFLIANPVSVEETEFLLAPGVVQCLGSAANTGVIAWYMTYTPLSPASVVAAAL